MKSNEDPKRDSTTETPDSTTQVGIQPSAGPLSDAAYPGLEEDTFVFDDGGPGSSQAIPQENTPEREREWAEYMAQQEKIYKDNEAARIAQLPLAKKIEEGHFNISNISAAKHTGNSQDQKSAAAPVKKQKQIIKPKERFMKTQDEKLSGNSQPSIYNKTAKTGNKKFVIKGFRDASQCAREKLSYDLLQLCGVKVPKTYIVEDDQKQLTRLASKFEAGYKDLNDWLGGSTDTSLIKDQTLNKKPIIGLFENFPIFAFLCDPDVVGVTLRNIGLIEHADHFETVKIDPGMSALSADKRNNDYILQQYLAQLTAKNPTFYYGDKVAYIHDRGNNSDLLSHSTMNQRLAGMQRVANLTDQQLHDVIYNKDLPSLSQQDRDEIYASLTQRRNVYSVVTQEMEQEIKNENQANSNLTSSTKIYSLLNLQESLHAVNAVTPPTATAAPSLPPDTKTQIQNGPVVDPTCSATIPKPK